MLYRIRVLTNTQEGRRFTRESRFNSGERFTRSIQDNAVST